MRIGFVTTEYVTEANFDGGLANYLQRVCLALLQLEHEPVVIVASKQDNVLIHKGIEVHQVQVQKPSLIMSAFHRLTRSYFRMSQNLIQTVWYLNQRVKRLHKERPFSVVQYANDCALFRSKQIPTIIRLSSYLPLWIEAGMYQHKHPFQRRQLTLLELCSIRRADAVYAPSRIIAETVQLKLKRPVQVIEPPFIMDETLIDDSIYEQILKGKMYALFVGRIEKKKGISTIAAIIEELLYKYPKLYFVFSGEERNAINGASMTEYIQQKAGDNCERIIFTGKLPHSRLYPILSQAKVVVLPSLIDNLPNTCLEAMAHNCIVVGTRGASFEQLIIDGENGFLCEIDQPTSLLTAIHKALNLSEEDRQRLGSNASRRIRMLRSEFVVSQVVEYYESVVTNFSRK